MKRFFLMTRIYGVLFVATIATAACVHAGDEPAGTVCNIKVLSDNVPDVSSLEAWKKSFIKDGMSDRDKALAAWKTVVAFQYQDSPCPNEFIFQENAVYDPIRVFNVYGYGICSYAAAHVEALGRYAGLG